MHKYQCRLSTADASQYYFTESLLNFSTWNEITIGNTDGVRIRVNETDTERENQKFLNKNALQFPIALEYFELKTVALTRNIY